MKRRGNERVRKREECLKATMIQGISRESEEEVGMEKKKGGKQGR